jgi:hypothetical protein
MIKIPKSLDELKNMITDHGILDAVKSNAAKIMQSQATEHAGGNAGSDSLDKLKALIQQQLSCVKSLEQYVSGLNSQLSLLQAKITQLESQVAPAQEPQVVAAQEPQAAVDSATAPSSPQKDEQ